MIVAFAYDNCATNYLSAVFWGFKGGLMVTLKGFEPLLADPESAVLPLNYRVTIGEIIASEI